MFSCSQEFKFWVLITLGTGLGNSQQGTAPPLQGFEYTLDSAELGLAFTLYFGHISWFLCTWKPTYFNIATRTLWSCSCSVQPCPFVNLSFLIEQQALRWLCLQSGRGCLLTFNPYLSG